MPVAAVALVGLLIGPPELPPDIGDVPPARDEGDSPSEGGDQPPSGDRAEPPAETEPEDVETPEQPPAEPPAEDEAIPVTPEDGEGASEGSTSEEGEGDDKDDESAGGGAAAAGGGAAGGTATGAGGAAGGASASGAGASGSGAGSSGAAGSGSGGSAPAVQRPDTPAPSGSAPQPQRPASASQPGAPTGSSSAAAAAAQPAGPSTSSEDQGAQDAQAQPEQDGEQEKEQDESYRKLGGFRLFRIGIAAKIGYTHGTSDKNGLYDRDKSIQDSIDNMMVTTSGAGDLGKTKFGGFQYGFILDAEVVGINVWLDFHKFFRPGGTWSLLAGYDHEFGFGKRLRLDVGVGAGLNHVFLGSALRDLYYDKDNPEAINIATLGVEGRAQVDLHIKIVGPLYTGPYAMLGYHYLWSANAAEVTAEKGLHYSAGWTLRLDFAAPKLIGGRKKKKK